MDGRPASLDSTLRVRLNADLYYFADRATRARFLRAPLRWCGALTDPVSLRRFRPTAASPSARVAGRTWRFETAATRAQFLARPAAFEETARMLPE